MFYNILIKLNK